MGLLKLRGEGGLPPYQFVWSTGANGASINSLSAGEYTVTMTDEGGCEITSSITIDSVAPLTRETMLHDVNCPGGADGSISIDAKGGTPPYTYLWSNGKTVTELTDLEYGAYQLTISDSMDACHIMTSSLTNPTLVAAYRQYTTHHNQFRKWVHRFKHLRSHTSLPILWYKRRITYRF